MWWQITKYTAVIQGQNILGLHFQGFILMPKPSRPASFQKATFFVSVIRLRILGLYSLPEQPVPVLGHPAREKLFSCSEETSWVSFCAPCVLFCLLGSSAATAESRTLFSHSKGEHSARVRKNSLCQTLEPAVSGWPESPGCTGTELGHSCLLQFSLSQF